MELEKQQSLPVGQPSQRRQQLMAQKNRPRTQNLGNYQDKDGLYVVCNNSYLNQQLEVNQKWEECKIFGSNIQSRSNSSCSIYGDL